MTFKWAAAALALLQLRAFGIPTPTLSRCPNRCLFRYADVVVMMKPDSISGSGAPTAALSANKLAFVTAAQALDSYWAAAASRRKPRARNAWCATGSKISCTAILRQA